MPDVLAAIGVIAGFAGLAALAVWQGIALHRAGEEYEREVRESNRVIESTRRTLARWESNK